MIPFDYKYQSGSASFAFAIFVIWLVYICIYWRSMVQILGASKFDSTDKILWFLVITLAPVIGIITFHAMCPPPLRNPPPQP